MTLVDLSPAQMTSNSSYHFSPSATVVCVTTFHELPWPHVNPLMYAYSRSRPAAAESALTITAFNMVEPLRPFDESKLAGAGVATTRTGSVRSMSVTTPESKPYTQRTPAASP